MQQTNQQWTENESKVFIDFSDIFVPSREEYIDTIVSLIPANRKQVFNVVELGAGDGVLAKSVLKSFPKCHYVALDGSKLMRDWLRKTISPFRERVKIRDFELANEKWHNTLPKPLRCVLASLIIHHLPADGKKKLFVDIAARLEPGGAFILGDLVEPAMNQITALFAKQWDKEVKDRSLKKTGNLKAFKFFQDNEWNYYADDEPDPYDQPSPLFDQLLWLREAGFKKLDCFWMRAGHAIFGGYK